MASSISLLLKALLVSLLVSVVSALHYNVVVDINSCNESPCVTLSTVVNNPETYLISDSTLTFLPGTHVLDHNGPILISDVSNLTLQGDGEVEDGFHWTIKQTNVFITCANSTGGFVFNRSSVHIEGLTITGCGTTGYNDFLGDALQLYTNGLYSNAFNVTLFSKIGTVLFFIDCPSVSLGSYLSVQNCSGNCLTFYNTHSIDMYHVYIAHNSPEHYKTMDCCDADPTRQTCVGGGAFFYYLDTQECVSSSDQQDLFNLTINMSSFSFSAGPGFFEGATVSGITIFDLFVDMLNVYMDSIMLYDNSGGNFGVISSYSNFIMSNISSLRANQYLHDICPSVSLGIAFKFSITNEVLCPALLSLFNNRVNYTFASVEITNSVFNENLAIDAPGINIDTTYVIDFGLIEGILSFTVEDSVILNNGAPLASCIGSGGFISYPARVVVKLKNIFMADNYFIEPQKAAAYTGIPPSCIVLIFTSGIEFENVTIINQPLLGILGINSELHFVEDNLIQNNTGGENGGALALESNCKLIINENSILRLIDNHAERGAGIYIFQPRTIPLIFALCLFQVAADNSSNSYIYFSGNKASITGDVIYGGSLDSCLLFSENKALPLVIPDLFVVADNQLNRTHYNVSSNPYKACICDYETDQLRCDGNVLHAPTVFPGQTVHCKVAAVGQLQGFTTGLVFVRATFLNSTYSAFYNISEPQCTVVSVKVSRQTVSNTSQFTLTTVPKNFSVRFNVELSSSRLLPVPEQATVLVPVIDCPPGFVVNDSFICQCNSLLESRADIIICEIEHNLITLLTDDVWVGYDYQRNSTVLSDICPFDYCNRSSTTFNLIDTPNYQCAYNRAGKLCGRCADGYSLLLGSNECGTCPNNNYLSLLLVFGAAGIGLVVLLILLNLTVSVGTINGLIFYANIVQINENIFFPDGRYVVLNTFISFLNLDFGFKTCFYSGMTPLAKVWLQFLFPIYLWTIIILIITAAKYSRKLSKLVSSNTVSVLVTMIFLSFTKLSRTLALVFNSSILYFEDGATQRVWSTDGNTIYTDPFLVLLTIAAILALIIVLLPFTLFAIFAPLQFRIVTCICPPLRGVLYKLSTRYPVFMLRLKFFSDAISGPLKESASYWIGITLAARVPVIFIVSFDSQVVLPAMFFIVLFILSIFAILGGVYKSLVNNCLELWALMNVLAITVLALSGYAKYGTIISISLMMVTFVIIIIFHIYWRVMKRFVTAIKEKVFNSSKRLSSSDITIPQGGKIQKEQILSDLSSSFANESVTKYREPLLDEPLLSSSY